MLVLLDKMYYTNKTNKITRILLHENSKEDYLLYIDSHYRVQCSRHILISLLGVPVGCQCCYSVSFVSIVHFIEEYQQKLTNKITNKITNESTNKITNMISMHIYKEKQDTNKTNRITRL